MARDGAIMQEIEFSREERDALCAKIVAFVADELEQEITPFDAGFLLDFFAREIGPAFYNRGLMDAQAALSARIDAVHEAIEELVKPTG